MNENLEKLIKETNIEAWKNIPQPVCNAIQGSFQAFDNIRRFLLLQENRFQNLTTTSEARNIEVMDALQSYKLVIQEKIEIAEQQAKNEMAVFDKRIQKSLYEMEQELGLKLQQQCSGQITTQMKLLKQWVVKTVDTKIKESERAQALIFDRKL